MTGIFKYVFPALVGCLLVSCGGHKADTDSSDDYYFDEDSAVVIEAVEAYIDDTDFVMADTCLDYDYYNYYVEEEADYSNEEPVYSYQEPVKEQPKPLVSQQSKPAQKESLLAKKEKLEERTESLFNIWKGRCEEYGIAGVFYIADNEPANNKITILVAFSEKDKVSYSELHDFALNIAWFVRTTVFQDNLSNPEASIGGDDVKLLYDVNPKFHVVIIGSDLTKESFDFTIKETYQ